MLSHLLTGYTHPTRASAEALGVARVHKTGGKEKNNNKNKRDKEHILITKTISNYAFFTGDMPPPEPVLPPPLAAVAVPAFVRLTFEPFQADEAADGVEEPKPR